MEPHHPRHDPVFIIVADPNVPQRHLGAILIKNDDAPILMLDAVDRYVLAVDLHGDLAVDILDRDAVALRR